jgi:hypothetical protein
LTKGKTPAKALTGVSLILGALRHALEEAPDQLVEFGGFVNSAALASSFIFVVMMAWYGHHSPDWLRQAAQALSGVS